MFVPHRDHTYGLSQLVARITPLYVDDVRTSQETYLLTSTASYKDSFTYLYVDGVRISQESHLWASTVCYRDNFTSFTSLYEGRKCWLNDTASTRSFGMWRWHPRTKSGVVPTLL
jgi:hypothetical protein